MVTVPFNIADLFEHTVEVGTTIPCSHFGQIGAASTVLGYFTNLVKDEAMA
jgi:hypothetical protein